MKEERKYDTKSWKYDTESIAQQHGFMLLRCTQLDVPSQRNKFLDLTGGPELQSQPPFTGWEAWDQFL